MIPLSYLQGNIILSFPQLPNVCRNGEGNERGGGNENNKLVLSFWKFQNLINGYYNKIKLFDPKSFIGLWERKSDSLMRGVLTRGRSNVKLLFTVILSGRTPLYGFNSRKLIQLGYLSILVWCANYLSTGRSQIAEWRKRVGRVWTRFTIKYCILG